MKKKTRILSGILCAVMTASLAGACGKKDGEDSGKLTYWMALDTTTATQYTSFADTEIGKALVENTGVEVEYIHPPTGQSPEKFNIMMAQNDLPDIVEAEWTGYPGGMGNAIDQNKVINLAEHLDKAPNFKKYLDENPEIKKLVSTDDGEIIGFPFIRGDRFLYTSAGPMLRKDWLDDLGLEVPETIDEWETVLTAFKNEKGAKAPLSFVFNSFIQYGPFVGAYGITAGYYVADGKIKYGPAEPAFKDFLIKMNDWYKKGILDSAIATQDGKGVNANILNGASGATVNSCGGGMGTYLAAATEEGFDLVAAPYPVLNKGEKPEFGQANLPVTGLFAAITTSCKDIDKAIKYLDYAYSEEGSMLFNFGIEGASYEMVDGYPKYTELITDNPEGKSMVESMAPYMRSASSGPFVQDKRYMEQYAKLPQQKQALEVWVNTNGYEHLVPHIYPENPSELAKVETSIKTYYQEMAAKFIMGIEPIDNFDNYVAELNKRGLEDLLKAKQAAYEKYLVR